MCSRLDDLRDDLSDLSDVFKVCKVSTQRENETHDDQSADQSTNQTVVIKSQHILLPLQCSLTGVYLLGYKKAARLSQ